MSRALFADLYEFTMAEAYLAEGMEGTAVFELYFRKLPSTRSYAIAAGLEDVLEFLESIHFEREDIDWLRSLGRFSEALLHRLERFRFTGDVWAMPEGTIVFGNEPILRVVAPILEAQLVETFLLNQVHVQMVIATKAARIVSAARDRSVVDFGARRAHGYDAGMMLARSSFLAGAAGTSLVEAGRRYDIPIYGTMAHSFVQAHADEATAFAAFARIHPGTTLLVDTYDTIAGVAKVIDLMKRPADPLQVGGIRLDSGDLGALASASRRLLDDAGLHQVRIFASSDLDEWAIERLVDEGAPIDAFGVGTRMAAAVDAPTLGVVYKLVEYAGIPRTKLSSTKVLYPGRKQVFRSEADGIFTGDVLAGDDEAFAGQPLLAEVMRGGRTLDGWPEPLAAARARVREGMARLPPALRSLETPPAAYAVRPSPALVARLDALRRGFGSDQAGL